MLDWGDFYEKDDFVKPLEYFSKLILSFGDPSWPDVVGLIELGRAAVFQFLLVFSFMVLHSYLIGYHWKYTLADLFARSSSHLEEMNISVRSTKTISLTAST